VTIPAVAVYLPDILDGYFPAEEVEKQLATAIDWGRYAELFEYDVNEGRLTLTMEE
jgi:NitT/TauT family transport system ATP-binding protein